MATETKVRALIQEIAGRPNNVTEDEIKWVVDQLENLGLETSSERNDHQVMYSVEGEQFGICTHHRGAKQIKRCYVRLFLTAMSNIGWYEDE
jgi:hypothetical protein